MTDWLQKLQGLILLQFRLRVTIWDISLGLLPHGLLLQSLAFLVVVVGDQLVQTQVLLVIKILRWRKRSCISAGLSVSFHSRLTSVSTHTRPKLFSRIFGIRLFAELQVDRSARNIWVVRVSFPPCHRFRSDVSRLMLIVYVDVSHVWLGNHVTCFARISGHLLRNFLVSNMFCVFFLNKFSHGQIRSQIGQHTLLFGTQGRIVACSCRVTLTHGPWGKQHWRSLIFDCLLIGFVKILLFYWLLKLIFILIFRQNCSVKSLLPISLIGICCTHIRISFQLTFNAFESFQGRQSLWFDLIIIFGTALWFSSVKSFLRAI